MSSAPKQTTTKETKNTKTTAATNETASKTPWSEASPYYSDLYSKGAAAVDAVNNKTFGGDFVTPATAGHRSAVQQLYDVAPTLSVGADPLRDMAMRIAGGEFLDPNNPT